MENTTQDRQMALTEYTIARGDIAYDAVNEMYLLLCRASINKEIQRDEMFEALLATWNRYVEKTDNLYVRATAGTGAI
jgi:hypothetical protein